MKTLHNPPTVHSPLAGYTHGIEIPGEQRWLVPSGQIGMDANGRIPEDPIEQLNTTLANIKHILSSAGMQVEDLVNLKFYLAEEISAQDRRQVVSEWLQGHRPAMTLLYVAGLASPQYKVEVDALACQEDG